MRVLGYVSTTKQIEKTIYSYFGIVFSSFVSGVKKVVTLVHSFFFSMIASLNKKKISPQERADLAKKVNKKESPRTHKKTASVVSANKDRGPTTKQLPEDLVFTSPWNTCTKYQKSLVRKLLEALASGDWNELLSLNWIKDPLSKIAVLPFLKAIVEVHLRRKEKNLLGRIKKNTSLYFGTVNCWGRLCGGINTGLKNLHGESPGDLEKFCQSKTVWKYEDLCSKIGEGKGAEYLLNKIIEISSNKEEVK